MPHDITLTSPTGRLKLVPPRSVDDAAVAALLAHPETLRYLPFLPTHVSPEDARARRERRALLASIVDFDILLCSSEDADVEFVGICGLLNVDRANDKCSVGILVAPARHRGGLATEALYTLLRFAFADRDAAVGMRMHRVAFETGVDNVQMRGWLEHVADATEEFRWREAWKAGPDKWVDAVGYSILEWEWRAHVQSRLEKRVGMLK